MGQVTVTVAGRAYRMACDPGEEPHLAELGRSLDERVTTLRESLGEVGDLRLIVMAAITCLDELNESRAEFAALREALDGSTGLSASAAEATLSMQADAAATISRLAQRLEGLARELGEETRQ